MATLNKKFYLTILQHLQEEVQKKQQELWWECSWFLCHNKFSGTHSAPLSVVNTKNKTSLV
jgi:hypothetical protein